MKKKILIIFLLAAVFTVAFAGCGQEESSENFITDRFENRELQGEIQQIAHSDRKAYNEVGDEYAPSLPVGTTAPAETYEEPTQDIWLP